MMTYDNDDDDDDDDDDDARGVNFFFFFFFFLLLPWQKQYNLLKSDMLVNVNDNIACLLKINYLRRFFFVVQIYY